MDDIIILEKKHNYKQIYHTDKPIYFLTEFLKGWLGINRDNRKDMLQELIDSILDPTDTGTATDFLRHERINNKIYINYDWENNDHSDDFIIEPENLVKVMQNWVSLTDKQAEKIILSQNENGYVEIYGITNNIKI